MLRTRVIPCLDVKDGRVVKGVQFEELRDAGDAFELAKRYNDEGADELVILDISATLEERKTTLTLVERCASALSIPLTVGGGIRSVEDMKQLMHHGADKVAVNSAALARPELLEELSATFGSQAVVLAIDARRDSGEFKVRSRAGTSQTEWNLRDWAQTGEERGAGEILLTSMDADGVQMGFDLEMLKEVRDAVSLPLVASGGAGELRHFVDAASVADALLAASVFHYGKLTVEEVKQSLRQAKIPVRGVSC